MQIQALLPTVLISLVFAVAPGPGAAQDNTQGIEAEEVDPPAADTAGLPDDIPDIEDV